MLSTRKPTLKDLPASARIKAETARAEEQLATELRDFLQSCDSGDWVSKAKRNPESHDLVPHFQTYACAIYDASARERLERVDSPRSARLYIDFLRDTVVIFIRNFKKSGGWTRAVHAALADVGLTERVNKYGSLSGANLISNHTTEIEEGLRRRAKHWESCAWDRVASSAGPAVKQYPTTVGKNIDRYRNLCGLSFDLLAQLTKLSKSTVLNHVNKGAKPHPEALADYAVVFSGKLGTTVTVEDLLAP
jgi:hypothetical protein